MTSGRIPTLRELELEHEVEQHRLAVQTATRIGLEAIYERDELRKEVAELREQLGQQADS